MAYEKHDVKEYHAIISSVTPFDSLHNPLTPATMCESRYAYATDIIYKSGIFLLDQLDLQLRNFGIKITSHYVKRIIKILSWVHANRFKNGKQLKIGSL